MTEKACPPEAAASKGQEVRPVLGIGRRKTRSQLVKAELGESFDHFMQAATHAAGGVGATMGPRAADGVQRVKGAASQGWESTMAAFAPLAVAAMDGAREAGRTTRQAGRKARSVTHKRESRMSRNRWPMLAGLLAAGAAVGAAGALVMRRRKQQQWQEYDPTTPMADPTPVEQSPAAAPDTTR